MFKNLKSILAAMPLFFAVILGGCGGGGGSGSGETPSQASKQLYSISGTVSGNATSGVTIDMTGGDVAVTTTTDASGNYSFGGLLNGTYVVTPTKLGSAFAPLSTTVTVSGANQPNTNFVASQTYGDLSGNVKDAVTGADLSGVSVAIYSGSGSLVASLTTDASGVYTATNLMVGVTYTATISKAGYIAANNAGLVLTQANGVTAVETVQLVPLAYSGIGTIAGQVKNAFTGLAVSGVTVNVRKGINARTGTILATTTTDATGGYTDATLAGGNYTGEASLNGYITGYFTVTVIGGTTTSGQDATITPVLPAGQTRIVLTWGATPADLDSHLTGPIAGSSSRFHVYYSNKGSSTAAPFAALDVDDTTSNGPETTTIYTRAGGRYRFSVHDFTNKSSTNSTALSGSGAQIKIYTSAGLVATYNVPVGQGGTLWSVFEMNGSVITPINAMSYVANETTIP